MNKNQRKRIRRRKEGKGKKGTRKTKRVQEKNGRCSGLDFVIFLEREHILSKIPVNPTVGFLRTKSKVVLHIVDYTWAPVLGVFDKLHEVGVLSYLFYPLFKCFVNACAGLRP